MHLRIKITAMIFFGAFMLSACNLGSSGGDAGINALPETLSATYTVTYEGNGSTGGTVPVDTAFYKQDQTVTVLGNTGGLVRTGYTFAGWNTQADGNGTDRSPSAKFAMGAGDVILYAKWTTDPTYSVTYYANGGTGTVPVDSNQYLPGAAVTVLGKEQLVKAGYIFAGWNTLTDGNGTDRAPASTFTMGSADVALYAKWTTDPTYRVTYNANGASGEVPVDSNQYLSGAAVTVPGQGVLERAGYTFVAWNTQADGNGIDRIPSTTFAIGAAHVTLYAKWTASPTYTVTYYANGGTGGVPADSSKYLAGATVTVLDKGTLARTGYTFTGWNTQADGNGADRAPASTFAMGTADVNLYARWTADAIPTYKVAYHANGGAGAVPVDSNEYLPGATVTVLAKGTLARAGYSFAGWNTQSNGNGEDRSPTTTFTIGASDVTLYAMWTADPTYTVTYDANRGSGGLPSDTNRYLAGATVTVLDKQTLARSGYAFTGWNTQADGSGMSLTPGSTFTIGAANVTLYAMWAVVPTYTVTYNANGGTGSVPSDSTRYPAGAAVTVLEKGNLAWAGYTFAGWNTQANGSGTDLMPGTTFTMGAANVNLYAKWTAGATYTVTYVANGGTGDVPIDSNRYEYGAIVTVLGKGALARAGYTFTGWNTQPDRSGTSRAAASTFTMGAANVTLYAKWSNKKLMFIHHSCGTYLLQTGNGNLGTTLNESGFFITESDYGWSAEPGDGLGYSTDTIHWPLWFNDVKMPYVYANNFHSWAYPTNTIADPGGENEIIMFKSCYPNSEVGTSIDDEKAIYNSLLPYFAAHRDKLFILITPPSKRYVESYVLTKQLCNWLVDRENGWLSGYAGKNVYAFDFYGVLSGANSHHRRVNGVTEYVYDPAYNGSSPYHPAADDHPDTAGNQKATGELITMLNYWYDCWK